MASTTLLHPPTTAPAASQVASTESPQDPLAHIPYWPDYAPFNAPANMGWEDGAVLTYVWRNKETGRVLFNATMFMNNGQKFNKETVGDDTKKRVIEWERRHKGLIDKVVELVHQNGTASDEAIHGITYGDVIDTTNANKKSGPDAHRGTYANIYLMPSMGRYVSDQFAAVVDSLCARLLIGDGDTMAMLKEMAAQDTQPPPAYSNKRRHDEMPTDGTEEDEGESEKKYLKVALQTMELVVKEQTKTIEDQRKVMDDQRQLIQDQRKIIDDTRLTIMHRDTVIGRLSERFDSDPTTINSRVLPDDPDQSATSEGCEVLRGRILAYANSVGNALFNNLTSGPAWRLRAFLSDVLNVQGLANRDGHVSIVVARTLIQRALKIRVKAGWGHEIKHCTEMTAREAYTVFYHTSAWMHTFCPTAEAMNNFGDVVELMRVKYKNIGLLEMKEGLAL